MLYRLLLLVFFERLCQIVHVDQSAVAVVEKDVKRLDCHHIRWLLVGSCFTFHHYIVTLRFASIVSLDGAVRLSHSLLFIDHDVEETKPFVSLRCASNDCHDVSEIRRIAVLLAVTRCENFALQWKLIPFLGLDALRVGSVLLLLLGLRDDRIEKFVAL